MNPCEVCKINDGQYNPCNGDGRLHHHGKIHAHPKTSGINSTNHLLWVCSDCAIMDGKNWESTRLK